MLAFYLTNFLQSALYVLLAVVAVTAARAEKDAGSHNSHLHLRRAGVLYALLAASQMLHLG